MVNKQKIKGSRFEREAAKMLNSLVDDSIWKVIPGSGAIGTLMDEAQLQGDISGEVKGFPKKFRGECKTGYSNRTGAETKSFTIQKKWLDKIKKEAESTYSFPVLFCHFDNARTGIKSIAVLDIEDFAKLINLYTEISNGSEE